MDNNQVQPQIQPQAQPQVQPQVQPQIQPQIQSTKPDKIAEDTLPSEYRPLGMWAYFGYTLLFSLPIIGLVCIIVLSFNDSNINRRNFARSYFCFCIAAIIISALVSILVFIFGILAITELESLYGSGSAATILFNLLSK